MFCFRQFITHKPHVDLSTNDKTLSMLIDVKILFMCWVLLNVLHDAGSGPAHCTGECKAGRNGVEAICCMAFFDRPTLISLLLWWLSLIAFSHRLACVRIIFVIWYAGNASCIYWPRTSSSAITLLHRWYTQILASHDDSIDEPHDFSASLWQS